MDHLIWFLNLLLHVYAPDAGEDDAVSYIINDINKFRLMLEYFFSVTQEKSVS